MKKNIIFQLSFIALAAVTYFLIGFDNLILEKVRMGFVTAVFLFLILINLNAMLEKLRQLLANDIKEITDFVDMEIAMKVLFILVSIICAVGIMKPENSETIHIPAIVCFYIYMSFMSTRVVLYLSNLLKLYCIKK